MRLFCFFCLFFLLFKKQNREMLTRKERKRKLTNYFDVTREVGGKRKRKGNERRNKSFFLFKSKIMSFIFFFITNKTKQ